MKNIVIIVLGIIVALYIVVQINGCDWLEYDNARPLLRIFQFDNTSCSCEGVRWFDPTFGYKLENLKPSYVPWTYYGDDCL